MSRKVVQKIMKEQTNENFPNHRKSIPLYRNALTLNYSTNLYLLFFYETKCPIRKPIASKKPKIVLVCAVAFMAGAI